MAHVCEAANSLSPKLGGINRTCLFVHNTINLITLIRSEVPKENYVRFHTYDYILSSHEKVFMKIETSWALGMVMP